MKIISRNGISTSSPFQVNKSSVLEISASLTDKPPPKKCYTLEFQN